MKTINSYTRHDFAAYLRHTLIPDFRSDDQNATAEDFTTALQFITHDSEVMHDAKKALLAASAHLPAGSNAAALVAASLAELEGTHHLDGNPRNSSPENLRVVDPAENRTRPQSRRCLEDNPKLSDR